MNIVELEPKTQEMRTADERSIRVERVFDAPRELVWRAFTEPELLARWWSCGNPMVVERLEVERGGRFRFVEQSGDLANVFEGRVREVVPNERLVQTLEWDRMPGHVMVETIKLTDQGGRTKVVSTTLFHTAAERWGMSTMEDGIVESFDTLEQLLVTMS